MSEQADHSDQGDGNIRPFTYAFAKENGLVLIGHDSAGRAVIGARSDSGGEVEADPWALAEAYRAAGGSVGIENLPADIFERKLSEIYSAEGLTAATFESEGHGDDLSELAEGLPTAADLLDTEDDAPIIRLINALLTEAVKENASDIHIEPQETRLQVRFRVDGVLREVLSPPRNLATLIVSRIKVMARLDIA
ncbi:MAG: ATPase, T2SS/T4P/T4SS family, partial [Pseudomonadota bacterium]